MGTCRELCKSLILRKRPEDIAEMVIDVLKDVSASEIDMLERVVKGNLIEPILHKRNPSPKRALSISKRYSLL